MNTREIPKNAVLKTGVYLFTFRALMFPEALAKFMKSIKGIIETVAEVIENKRIRIIDIYNVPETNLVKFKVELIDNPVPVGLVVAGIIGLLGVAGLLLTLTKVEEIIDSPAGIGIGLWLIVGALAFGYTFYKKAGKGEI